MNYELEAYEGELRKLRLLEKQFEDLPVMDVWHEDTQKFYRAVVFYPISTEEVHGNQYG